MRAILVLFDSLNRHMLPPYGADWVHAPNFQRLADRSVCFDSCYVGSMPCMPARRELHTGRYNFLHRSWGPLEPFDDSMLDVMRARRIHSHLVSDHYHYWEEGGANYHTRYNTWQISRGQEGDPWKPILGEFPIPPNRNPDRGAWGRQDWANRVFTEAIADHPQAVTVSMGLDFLDRNAAADNWFLQIETFDPHEPYFSHPDFHALYPDLPNDLVWDWPSYCPRTESDAEMHRMRMQNAALISMCDHHLGRVLDAMDRHGLWESTLLIVGTDHGFLLGEHEWWGKCEMPFYNEIAHTPLFVWDPRARAAGERRGSLVQTIDLAPTLLDFFDLPIPVAMQGVALRDTIAHDAPVREAGLFGVFGGHVNVTDGRHVYMRAPASADNKPLFEYTLMPAHMRRAFAVEELQDISLADPFPFSKNCRCLRIPAAYVWGRPHDDGTLLFDLQADPAQNLPARDPAVERRMIRLLCDLMSANAAPLEQFQRLGLPNPSDAP